MENRIWKSILWSNRQDLAKIVEMFGLAEHKAAFSRFLQELTGNFKDCPEEVLTGLYRALNSTWDAAPDVGSIHLVPGWSVLCNLCAEFGED